MKGDFEQAFKDLLKFEGGYANNPKDRGGETYKGIARNFWPKWEGWGLIDKYKVDSPIAKFFPLVPISGYRDRRAYQQKIDYVLDQDQNLQRSVFIFYYVHFWKVIGGDDLPTKLARKVFDTSVNMGTSQGVKFLQKAVNNLNRGKYIKKWLVVDGAFGPNTLKVTNAVIKAVGEDLPIDNYCDMQASRYRAIVRYDPSQETWLNGWLKRAAYRGQ